MLFELDGVAPRLEAGRLGRTDGGGDRRRLARRAGHDLVQLPGPRRRQPDPHRRAHQHPGRLGAAREPRRGVGLRDRRGCDGGPHGDCACLPLENFAFVGMGATVLDGAVIEEGAMLAAGGAADAAQAHPEARALGRPARPQDARLAGRRAGGDGSHRGALCGPRPEVPRPGCVKSDDGPAGLAIFKPFERTGVMLRKLLFATACLLPMAARACRSTCRTRRGCAPGQFGNGRRPGRHGGQPGAMGIRGSRPHPRQAGRCSAGVGAMDYIAGELYTSPRWANIPALTQEQLLQGRREVREALGVAPGAPSQAVVDDLTAGGGRARCR